MKRLADRLELPGITFNTAGGLVIEIEANQNADALRFLESLKAEAPSASRIEHCVVEELAQVAPYSGFAILKSAAPDSSFTLVSADIATCAACLAEINDPGDRRFHYPFNNCTNCGPRYSITLSTPYDRSSTTMHRFHMCHACALEYSNPSDRRFHAEPVACPECGPELSLDLSLLVALLAEHRIVALKGLGGYQLACDAFCSDAVERLRIRKRRSRKPFAVMMRNLETVERYCLLTEPDRQALQSYRAPIVLLKVRDPGVFPSSLAPGLPEIGVMLPYTPLHHLLFTGPLDCLVMTSGNVSEEPIVTQDDEAREKLSRLADHVVTHNRDIFMRVDDSVIRTFEAAPRVLRRARGYAPETITLGFKTEEVLAVGGQFKNTFCLTKGPYAILSQHIGDLENYETLQFFEETLRNLQSIYHSTPRLIAHDLHPDYLGTRWALARPEPKLAVQHHHAHIASCMAENGLDEPVIGIAMDGTGFGTDSHIWGGEILSCTYRSFERWAHLRYVPLPGGDRASRESWRMAAAHLSDALGPEYRSIDLPCWNAAPPASWKILDRMMAKPAILTSSCGRLFDAVAAICGISQESSYEGESAMLLEAAALPDDAAPYQIALDTSSFPWILEHAPHDGSDRARHRRTAGRPALSPIAFTIRSRL